MNNILKKINHPLMSNNIDKDDTKVLISFLKTYPRLTASEKVFEFEKKCIDLNYEKKNGKRN